MHRWDTNAHEWVDAEAVIEIEGNTAVSRKGAHNVSFAANANTAGAVTLVTPDGKTMRSHVLGIAWFDSANNRSEMVGTLKDSIGVLYPPDVVLYADAFDGVKADIRYTMRLGSFEQDIILRENVPLPEGYAPDATRLEVWTEFIEAPSAYLTQTARSGMTDDTLDFGAMQTGPGNAFSLSDQPNPKHMAPVAKRWLTIDGRTLLVEAVRYSAVKTQLEQLPVPGQAALNAPNPKAQLAVGGAGVGLRAPQFGERHVPPAPQARTKSSTEKFRTAALNPSRARAVPTGEGVLGAGGNAPAATTNASLRLEPPLQPFPANGLVLDYVLLSGSRTNFTFQCDTTYCVSNTVNFYGTPAVTFEGGTVIKFAKSNVAQLNLNGSAVWLTSGYRPAIFTAVDDHTVGQPIGNATLSGYYGGAYLNYAYNDTNAIHNVRFTSAQTAIKTGEAALLLRHAQLMACGTGINGVHRASVQVKLENVLLYYVSTPHLGANEILAANVTVNGCDGFSDGDGNVGTFINCLFISMDSWGTCSPTEQYCFDSEGAASSIFQTVGAAAHYLAPNSPYRNAGTTSGLSAQLLADLKTLTTYPPILLGSTYWITNDVTLSPQAQRDTDTPDLGYHYTPLDFALQNASFTNAHLTLLPGTAVATYSLDGNYGIYLTSGSQMVSTGTPTNMNRIVRYNTVQEQANTNWTPRVTSVKIYSTGSGTVNLSSTFTEWDVLATDVYHLDCDASISGNLGIADSQIHGGTIFTYRNSLSMTNCLLNRVIIYLEDYGSYDDFVVNAHQNLFRGGSLDIFHLNAATWFFTNNLFDSIGISQFGDVANDYNGYVTNGALTPVAGHNVTNSISPAYQTWRLGYFYQPTSSPFIDKGSVSNAALLGFYHYTTLTNQTKEATNKLDIGFHYIALDMNGLTIDADGDGWPDYWEDSNGDGALNHRETKPNDPADRGLRVFITRPKSGSTIP